MTFDSEQFERQIARVHELIEGIDADVTWDDRVPDPDRPMQTRQIDVSIRRDGQLTLVECRLRKRPQDVDWIEGLVGRRLSLRADAVIAVSASGFTEGAKRKALVFGIVLRDLQALTVEEIQGWGQATKVKLTWVQYENLFVDLGIDASMSPPPPRSEVRNAVRNLLPDILNEVGSKALDQNCGSLARLSIEGRLSITPQNQDQLLLTEAMFQARIIRKEETLHLASVVAYDAPDVGVENRAASIEKIGDGEFEILHWSTRRAVTADFSNLDYARNSQLFGWHIDFGANVKVKLVEPIGLKLPRLDREVLRYRAHPTIA